MTPPGDVSTATYGFLERLWSKAPLTRRKQSNVARFPSPPNRATYDLKRGPDGRASRAALFCLRAGAGFRFGRNRTGC
jgi:hypothetical protein